MNQARYIECTSGRKSHDCEVDVKKIPVDIFATSMLDLTSHKMKKTSHVAKWHIDEK